MQQLVLDGSTFFGQNPSGRRTFDHNNVKRVSLMLGGSSSCVLFRSLQAMLEPTPAEPLKELHSICELLRCIACKYLTRVEVSGNNKPSSLLLYRITYDYKTVLLYRTPRLTSHEAEIQRMPWIK
jgi:hypothetical protein